MVIWRERSLEPTIPSFSPFPVPLIPSAMVMLIVVSRVAQ